MMEVGPHIAGWLGRHRWQLLAVLAVLVLYGLAVSGCSTTRTVTVPAAEPTVTVEVPDTSREAMLPPPEPIGDVTRPETVILYDDTATYDVDLSWLEVDRTGEDQTVTVRTQRDSQTVERRFQLPAFGEALQLRADSQGLQGSVQGEPQERQQEATAVEVPWWERAKMHVRFGIAFVGGVVFGVFGARLFFP
jgi:hypothetical protein